MPEKVIPTPVESCCDFLRLSVPTETSAYDEVHDVFQAFEMQEAQSGQEPRHYYMAKYSMSGYGDVSHGRLSKHGLFNVSGPLAHEVLEVMKNRTDRARCTRIDAKVSAKYGQTEAIRTARRLTKEHWQNQEEGRCRPDDLQLIDAAGKGDTVYMGKRDSASFARIYQADIRHPERYEVGTLSFEVQHNKKTADTAYHMMRSSANMHLCAGSMVVGRLLSLGVRESWFGEIPPSHVMQRKHISQKETTLKWVKSSVRGSFIRACREGWEIDYLASLGFDNLTYEQAQQIIDILEVSSHGYGAFGDST